MQRGCIGIVGRDVFTVSLSTHFSLLKEALSLLRFTLAGYGHPLLRFVFHFVSCSHFPTALFIILNRLRGELSVLYFSCICVVILEITFISTGISYGQSNSDIEALHQAYCHIAHSLGDADEQRTESNAAEDTKSSTKDHLQENEGSSKNISTTESGKSVFV